MKHFLALAACAWIPCASGCWDGEPPTNAASLSGHLAPSSRTSAPARPEEQPGRPPAPDSVLPVKLLTAGALKELYRPQTPAGEVWRLQVSNDSRTLFVGRGREARIWKQRLAKELVRIEGARPGSIMNWAGKWVMARHHDRVLYQCIDPLHGEFGKAPYPVESIPDGACFSPDDTLYMTINGNVISFWDQAKKEVWLEHTPPVDRITSLRLSPSNKYLVLSGMAGDEAKCLYWALNPRSQLDLRNGQPRVFTGHRAAVLDAELDEKGVHLISVSQDRMIRVMQANKMTLETEVNIDIGAEVTAANIRLAVNRIAVGYSDGRVVLWNPITGARSPACRHAAQPVTAVDVGRAPAGELEVYIGYQDGSVLVWTISPGAIEASDQPADMRLVVEQARRDLKSLKLVFVAERTRDGRANEALSLVQRMLNDIDRLETATADANRSGAIALGERLVKNRRDLLAMSRLVFHVDDRINRGQVRPRAFQQIEASLANVEALIQSTFSGSQQDR